MKLLITAIRQSRCGFNYKISFPELSRVYRNDLKGNKNYLELAAVFLHYFYISSDSLVLFELPNQLSEKLCEAFIV